MSPDELEEKARLITQVLELQNTLDGKLVFILFKISCTIYMYIYFYIYVMYIRLIKHTKKKKMNIWFNIFHLDLSQRVDSVKEENLKLRSENQVLGQYIENLMSASSVFQTTSPRVKKKWIYLLFLIYLLP